MVPEDAKRELRRGTIAAVVAAEAMSTVRLFDLGRRIGLQPGLAWLLPAALDVYAITMLRFSSRVPDRHPLRRKAAHEATFALVLTVGCNALYEVIVAFAAQLPSWAPGALFVLVCALAPLVAGRMIHFQALLTPRSVADDARHEPRHAADRLSADEEPLDQAPPEAPQQPEPPAENKGEQQPVPMHPLDPESDLALLRATRSPSGSPLAWLTLSKADAVRRVDELMPGRTASQVVQLLAAVGVEVDSACVRKTRSRARQADTIALPAQRGAS